MVPSSLRKKLRPREGRVPPAFNCPIAELQEQGSPGPEVTLQGSCGQGWERLGNRKEGLEPGRVLPRLEARGEQW